MDKKLKSWILTNTFSVNSYQPLPITSKFDVFPTWAINNFQSEVIFIVYNPLVDKWIGEINRRIIVDLSCGDTRTRVDRSSAFSSPKKPLNRGHFSCCQNHKH